MRNAILTTFIIGLTLIGNAGCDVIDKPIELQSAIAGRHPTRRQLPVEGPPSDASSAIFSIQPYASASAFEVTGDCQDLMAGMEFDD